MHTQHINNVNPYMVASVTRISSVLTYPRVMPPGSHKRTACNHHFHQKCHPQCVWSRDVTNQLFQVVSPKQWTA